MILLGAIAVVILFSLLALVLIYLRSVEKVNSRVDQIRKLLAISDWLTGELLTDNRPRDPAKKTQYEQMMQSAIDSFDRGEITENDIQETKRAAEELLAK